LELIAKRKRQLKELGWDEDEEDEQNEETRDPSNVSRLHQVEIFSRKNKRHYHTTKKPEENR